MIEFILLGLFVKLIMGFDDAITHIPVMSATTKSTNGRLWFATGTLLALTFIIILAIFFSNLISKIPYHRYIMAAALIAFAIYLCRNALEQKRTIKTKQLVKKVGVKRMLRALTVGFVVSMFALLDDVIAYTPILVNNTANMGYIISGIYAGALLEILAVIFFAKQLQRFKYKNQAAALGLATIAVLLLLNVI